MRYFVNAVISLIRAVKIFIFHFVYIATYFCIEDFRGMESRRQHKMASLLKQTLGDIFLRDIRSHISSGVLVSITQVRTSPDLAIARFYLSVFGSDEPQLIVDMLNTTAYEWRRKLGAELKNHLRKIPEIEFFLDDTMEYAQKMNELLNKLNDESKD